MEYENNSKFTLKDIILQILFVVLFVFILMWLFPTKGFVTSYVDNKVQPLYDRFFNENINTMKDAAKSYYTTERLPQNVGDKTKMTLGEMLDKKLLLKFKDSNNKSCNVDDSYVEITKGDNEYQMKVKLKCTDKSDYIIVHMGCYQYCTTAICEKKAATVSTPTVIKTTTGAKTTEQKVYETPTKKNYLCEYLLVTNGKWGSWGEWSSWTTDKAETTEYREVESKSVKIQTGTVTVEDGTTTETTKYETSKKYTCPSGGTLNGTTCTIDQKGTYKAASTTKYTCPSGGSLSGTTCVVSKTGTYKAASVTRASCPSGGSLSGTTCVRTGSYSARAVTTTSNVSGWYDTAVAGYECGNTRRVQVCSTCSTYKTQWYCTHSSASTSYSCPKGGSLSGSTCYISSNYDASISTSYSCPNGGSLSGSTCTLHDNATYAANVKTSYNCSKGGSLSGSTCTVTRSTNYNATPKVTYSCPADYTQSGSGTDTKCTKTIKKYKQEPVYETRTYYRYRTRNYISGIRDYKWSSCSGDSNLSNQGYKMTGKKKEV